MISNSVVGTLSQWRGKFKKYFGSDGKISKDIPSLRVMLVKNFMLTGKLEIMGKGISESINACHALRLVL
jgi:hypothetical protein